MLSPAEQLVEAELLRKLDEADIPVSLSSYGYLIEPWEAWGRQVVCEDLAELEDVVTALGL